MRRSVSSLAIFLLVVVSVQSKAGQTYTEDFSILDPVMPLGEVRTPWTKVAGNTWGVIEGDHGKRILRSLKETGEEGDASGQIYYGLDSLPFLPVRIALQIRVEDATRLPPGSSATFLVGFSEKAEIGRPPDFAFSVAVNPRANDQRDVNLTEVPVELVCQGREATDPQKVVTLTETLDATSGFRLEIVVDPAAETVRARVDNGPYSDALPMAFPWNAVRLMRLYERNLAVTVESIEFSE